VRKPRRDCPKSRRLWRKVEAVGVRTPHNRSELEQGRLNQSVLFKDEIEGAKLPFVRIFSSGDA
jgi:hypothetical protein